MSVLQPVGKRHLAEARDGSGPPPSGGLPVTGGGAVAREIGLEGGDVVQAEALELEAVGSDEHVVTQLGGRRCLRVEATPAEAHGGARGALAPPEMTLQATVIKYLCGGAKKVSHLGGCTTLEPSCNIWRRAPHLDVAACNVVCLHCYRLACCPYEAASSCTHASRHTRDREKPGMDGEPELMHRTPPLPDLI